MNSGIQIRYYRLALPANSRLRSSLYRRAGVNLCFNSGLSNNLYKCELQHWCRVQLFDTSPKTTKFPVEALDAACLCAVSISVVASLLVAGVIAAAAILVFVATVISLVLLVAVKALVVVTGDCRSTLRIRMCFSVAILRLF